MNKLLQSRISLPGVASGIAIALSCNTLFLSFLVALGIWSYKPADLPTLSQGFWLTSSAIWIVSVFVGVLVGSLVSGALSRGSLTLSALVIWAGSYIFFGGLLPSMAEVNTMSFEQISHKYLWLGFAGDFFSAIAAVLAAFLAYRIHFPATSVERRPFAFEAPLPT